MLAEVATFDGEVAALLAAMKTQVRARRQG